MFKIHLNWTINLVHKKLKNIYIIFLQDGDIYLMLHEMIKEKKH